MENIHLNFNENNWHQSASPEGYVRGTAFLKEACLKDADLTNQLPIASASNKQWKNTLLSLNGFFSVVCFGQNGLVAAVDRIRSIPIFYGKADGRVYLSDNAEWVRQQVGDKEMDPVARDEFQLAGYVTGQEMLFPNVKQLQAGELLRITLSGSEPQIETYRYYWFTHTEPSEWDEPTLREELDRVTETSIKRLIKYADGRQIVVPLSGGYDSRLIVTMLKRLGYYNILAFTYGVPGNKESEYSRKVADALGIKWHFVEYSKELWHQAWQTDERWQYQKWASGWNSIPHVQDWPAVKRMKQEKAIDPNCVFAPGHSGDFVAGSHLPSIAFDSRSFNEEDLSNAIFERHYSLAPLAYLAQKDKRFWKNRALSTAEKIRIDNNHDFADGFEKWDWQERQAKFICNSVRVYEFFGYDWWMPQWDAEFMAFWESVPLRLREGRKWYANYVKCIYAKETSEQNDYVIENAATRNPIRILAKNWTPSLFQKIIRSVKPIQPRAWKVLRSLDRYPRKDVLTLLKKGYSHNGIVAYFFFIETNLNSKK